MQISPLTPVTVKTYNTLLTEILNRPLLKLFLEIGVNMIEVKPQTHYINRLVQEMADNTSLNPSTLNIALQQVNAFYNSTVASYELVNLQDPDQKELSKLEEIIAALMVLESSKSIREILIEVCDEAMDNIAIEYDFFEAFQTLTSYDDLVIQVNASFGEMGALSGAFFSLMDASQMLRKGATEEEFYELALLVTMVLGTFNEVRKHRYVEENEVVRPSLSELVKPYSKTKVNLLFHLGRENLEDKDFSYKELGLTKRNKKQLLSLGSNLHLYYHDFDDKDAGLEFYAIVHAWKALSELKVPEARGLFVSLLKYFFEENDESDWMASFFQDLIAPFRADMFDESVEIILDEEEHEWVRSEFIDVLKNMLKNEEVSKDQVSNVFKRLYKESKNAWVNASAITVCKDENLSEHYQQIKKLYEKKLVDKSLDGDLEDVELAFGMRSERSTPRDLGLNDDIQKIFGNEINTVSPQKQSEPKVGRNDSCPCGSGKKYKKCCMNND